jgi:hypothetical protein
MRESLIDSIFSMTVYMLTGSRDVVNATNAVIGLSEPVLASSTSDYESASSSIKLYSFFYFEKLLFYHVLIVTSPPPTD